MTRPADEVGVDSGMLVIIDPCLLFTDKQWSGICARGHAKGGDIHLEIVRALGKRAKLADPDTAGVCVSTADGDGSYKVRRVGAFIGSDPGLLIEGA